jgi:hypothetical protein
VKPKSPPARPKPLKVFVEGGGDAKNQPKGKDLRVDAAEAVHKLIARGVGREIRVQACGGRKQAFDKFVTALQLDTTTPILLVDAEAPVADIEDPWAHLKTRDGWAMPAGTDDDHAFLMVQAMETWLLADPAALASAVGKGYKPAKITKWASLEAATKEQMKDALGAATRECDPPYDKGTHSFRGSARIGRRSEQHDGPDRQGVGVHDIWVLYPGYSPRCWGPHDAASRDFASRRLRGDEARPDRAGCGAGGQFPPTLSRPWPGSTRPGSVRLAHRLPASSTH